MYTVLLPMLAGSDSMGTLLSEFQATIDPVKFDEEAAKVDIGDVVAGLSKDIWGKY